MRKNENQFKWQQPLDVVFLEKHFLCDASLLQDVLSNYIITFNDTIHDMRESLSTNNIDQIARAAHKLRGATLNFIKNDLTDCLELVECNARAQHRIQINFEDIKTIEQRIQALITQLNLLIKKWNVPRNEELH